MTWFKKDKEEKPAEEGPKTALETPIVLTGASFWTCPTCGGQMSEETCTTDGTQKP